MVPNLPSPLKPQISQIYYITRESKWMQPYECLRKSLGHRGAEIEISISVDLQITKYLLPIKSTRNRKAIASNLGPPTIHRDLGST